MTTVTGGCLCGRLRYSVTAEPTNPHYCSCTQCQRWSGAPMVAWIDAPRSAVQFEGGDAAWYRSSDRAQRGFCATCGGTVFYQADGSALLGITTASLDEPDRFRPERWSYAESAPAWLPPPVGNGKRGG